MAAKDWSTRAGVVQKDSIVEAGKGIKATVINKDGKPSTIGAYTEKTIAQVREAAESGKSMVFRGDLLGGGDSLHLGASYIAEQGAPRPAKPKADKADKAPKPELTAEEKEAKGAANRAAALARDANRVAVVSGSVAEGEKIDVHGEEKEVGKLGVEFEVTEKNKDDLLERFGYEFAVGDKVQYANFAAEPEANNEPA